MAAPSVVCVLVMIATALAAAVLYGAGAAALSSVRVMGPCSAMGPAAAHALDLTSSGSVHDIDISRLSERLAANLGGTI